MDQTPINIEEVKAEIVEQLNQDQIKRASYDDNNQSVLNQTPIVNNVPVVTVE